MCIPGLFSSAPEPETVAPAPIAPVQQAIADREQAADPRRAGAAARSRKQRALAAVGGGQAGGTVLGPATGGREARNAATPLAGAAALNRTLGA